VLGFAEPDPNSKIYCAFSPAKAGLRSDQRAPSSAPFKGNAVLEYGPTEILPPIGANWKTLRVSADPVAKPAALTRAESRGSRPSKTFAGERQTVCWREMDSFRNRKFVDSLLEGDGFEPSVPRQKDNAFRNIGIGIGIGVVA
jgi:hypothetical protein